MKTLEVRDVNGFLVVSQEINISGDDLSLTYPHGIKFTLGSITIAEDTDNNEETQP